MATTNADIARDILLEAWVELVGRGLISEFEKDDLRKLIEEFVEQSMIRRNLTDDEIFMVKSKKYVGYQWLKKGEK